MRTLKFILTCVSILMLMFFGGCSPNKPDCNSKISEEDYPWMQRFFEYLLFSHGGAYTLHGSKPMTCFEVSFYSYEELLEIQKSNNEEVDKSSIIVENCGFPENWLKWEQVKDRFDFPGFILTSKKDPDYPKLSRIFFVNVLEMALVIQKYYSMFRKELGFEFDPLSVVFEIHQEQSVFWDVVSEHSDLIGLLYGFGFRNSQCFNWKFSEEVPESFKNSLQLNLSTDWKCKNFSGHEKACDLQIPVFCSFQQDDPVIKKYEEEREKIQKLYAEKDVVKIAVEHLARSN